MYIYLLIHVCICVCIYICMNIYMCKSKWETYLLQQHRMCVSKDGIKIKWLCECLQRRHQHQMIVWVSPKTASRSNHTIICVNASLWCGRKVKDCIITICAPPLTLCTGWICPFFSCPPMCVCIIRHIYVHAHTRMMTPTTLIMSANVNAYNSWHQVCVSRTIVTNHWIQAWWPPPHS